MTPTDAINESVAAMRYVSPRDMDSLVDLLDNARRVVLVGNGGLLSVASHIATDLWTQAHINAVAPTDVAYLTAQANDHGHVYMLVDFVRRHVDSVLVAMSCSGRSENVLVACHEARAHATANKIVTMSGFDEDNPLRRLGDLNFYIPSRSYGVVQVACHAILHAVCDTLASTRCAA